MPSAIWSLAAHTAVTSVRAASRIPAADERKFHRQLFGLFVKYGIRSAKALRNVYPEWKGGGLFAWNIWLARAYHLRQRLLGRNV